MKRITIYMAVIAVAIFACNAGVQKNQTTDSIGIATENTDQIKEPVLSPDGHQATKKSTPIQAKKETDQIDWNKKIIKNAFIKLEVKGYEIFNKNMHESLANFGAYISEEEQNQDMGEKSNQITIKVPVEQFENLINSFSGDSIKLIEKKISSEEVTDEMVDTRSRIEAKKQVREKYLDLLKGAKNMKEVLDVQQEINGVQESIESATGRVKYLTHQSAYSTIHLKYAEYMQPTPPAEDQTGFWVRLAEGFNGGIKIFSSLIIFLVTIWPLLLTGTIAILLWKKRKTHQSTH